MWFKHRAWIPVAWLLSAANVVAVWFAAMPGEPLHATAHALLAALFGVGAQRLANRHRVTAVDDEMVGSLRDMEEDLVRLQGVEGRLPELEERLDFIERALVEVRARRGERPRGDQGSGVTPDR